MNNIKYQKDWIRLSPSLSSLETWGFGLSGTLMWIGTAPSLQAALGAQAMLVWIPATFMGILLNLQIKRLGMQWPEMSGGTPNYATRLLKNYPGLARYAALGYFMGWASVPTINASILTNLIKTNLDALGINCPEQLLQVLFTLIPYVVAFSGTRALGILHISFLIPAIGFLAAFCVQGIEWLIFSTDSPGFIPVQLPNINALSLKEWAMWFFFAMYAVYDCETASSFVADSQKPSATLKCLSFAAWLMVPICIGGSWILMCLGTDSAIGDNTLLMFVAVAKPFWGSSTSFLVTFLIVCSSLLTSATAVSNSPRVIYQLALDRHIAPVFAIVSRQGVLEPGLILTLILSCIYLLWGDFSRIVLITAVGFLPSIMAVHLGLWLRRDKPYVLFPRWALCFFLVEVIVLLVGGWGWGWQNLVIGLLLPFGVMAMDFAIRRSSFALFHPAWWISRYKRRFHSKTQDFVLLQVGTLLFLVCGATVASWVFRAQLNGASENTNVDLLVVLLLCVAFVAVGIACWTSLPQVSAIAQAHKQAELLFQIALDAIVVVDNQGVIRSCNPATEQLFQTNRNLIGLQLNKLLPQLPQNPEAWLSRSEQTLTQDSEKLRIVEVAISERSDRELQEYVVILRDITEAKQGRIALQESEERFRQMAESINQVFWMTDNEKNEIIYISPAYESIWGRTCQSLYQQDTSFIDAIHPEDRPNVIEALTQQFTQVYDQEYRIIRPDGTERWIRDRAFPIRNHKGKIYRVAGVAEDVTLAKQAAEALRQSEARLREQATQLEQALRNLQNTQAQLIQSEKMSSLGQLVAGVAHEINNPVNFIYGNLTYTNNYFQDLLTVIKLYQQGYPYTDPKVQNLVSEIDLDFLLEDIAKLLASMKIGAERIREIVLTLRNFSRLDEAEMKPVDIHEGIDSTLLILQNRLKIKTEHPPIEIIKEYGDLPQVECYAGQLNQVFMNILSNAIDAFDNYSLADRSKEIEKTSSKITIRTQILNSDWVAICIKDNGYGMTEEVKQKLFDPFFTTKPIGKGTGLGLSISYQIVVDKHSGQLKCISAPGEGSEFIIEIPIRQSVAVNVKSLV